MKFQEGEGKYVSPDGSVWEGTWESNVREGEGKYTAPSGLKIEG
jgi:hypothetical protein